MVQLCRLGPKCVRYCRIIVTFFIVEPKRLVQFAKILQLRKQFFLWFHEWLIFKKAMSVPHLSKPIALCLLYSLLTCLQSGYCSLILVAKGVVFTICFYFCKQWKLMGEEHVVSLCLGTCRNFSLSTVLERVNYLYSSLNFWNIRRPNMSSHCQPIEVSAMKGLRFFFFFCTSFCDIWNFIFSRQCGWLFLCICDNQRHVHVYISKPVFFIVSSCRAFCFIYYAGIVLCIQHQTYR